MDGEDVGEFTTFMTLLAPPPPPVIKGQARSGNTIFTQIGCDGCHVRSITSGPSEIAAALSNQTYQPFSDFLVHDMGTLGDMIGDDGDSVAVTRRMRTAPLWGIRFRNHLLHDGSVDTIPAAVARHDGQAAASAAAFAARNANDRHNLVQFVRSL